MIFQRILNSQIETLVLEKGEIAMRSDAEIASLIKQTVAEKLVSGNKTIVSLQANIDTVKKTVNSLVDEKSKLLQDISLKVQPFSISILLCLRWSTTKYYLVYLK